MAGKCDHADSRLKCIECDAPICSNCMTECPVGNRCRACIGGPALNAATAGAPVWLVAKTLGICTAIGLAGGWIMLFIQIPYVTCIISFMLGLVAGKWLAGILDHRLGQKVGTIVVFGLLIGMALSPFNAVVWVLIEVVREPLMGDLSHLISGLNALVNIIFCPVCFIVGVLRPSIWGQPY
ncbi:hypothetical protein BH10CYA1_BH10CYA1_11900 [soil metagenome]